jgi:hypothetical protein
MVKISRVRLRQIIREELERELREEPEESTPSEDQGGDITGEPTSLEPDPTA